MMKKTIANSYYNDFLSVQKTVRFIFKENYPTDSSTVIYSRTDFEIH